jgi:hypothetical protein
MQLLVQSRELHCLHVRRWGEFQAFPRETGLN